jgi:hypothetical protein
MGNSINLKKAFAKRILNFDDILMMSYNATAHQDLGSLVLAWYAELLLEIDLKILLGKTRSNIELQDCTYIFAH